MKNFRVFATGIALALTIVSCKKMDEQAEIPSQSEASATPKVEWKKLTNWSAETDQDNAIYRASIDDASLTDSLAANSLVLAFKKTDNGIVSLPYQEKTGDESSFWYYQVESGSIQFTVEGSAKTIAPDATTGFNYLVFSPDKLTDLESKGYNKDQLMTLTYETATTLLK